MLLRTNLANYNSNGSWTVGSNSKSCGPTGEQVVQFAKSIVCSSLKGKYDKKIFYDLDESEDVQNPPTWTDPIISTCFSPRKFGTLWDRAPSAFEEISSKDENFIPVQDFFVIELDNCVIPRQITIDQVVSPGAVTKIWLYNIAELCWHLIWSKRPTGDIKKSRLLCVNLKDQIAFGTKFLRVEMNQSKLKNHTQIGMIEVYGEKFVLGCSLKAVSMKLDHRKQSTLKALRKEYERFNKKTVPTEDYDGLDAALKLTNPERFVFHDLQEQQGNTTLNLLDFPYELQTKIFSYVDVKTLFVLSCVSKRMYNLVTDPIIYREINLKMYWHMVNDEFLLKLSRRATKIRKLDISWCGWHNSVSPSVFMYFVRRCCQKVTHLQINSCVFFTIECFHVVANVCEELRELSLHGYGKTFSKEKNISFSAVKHLQKIDFYRTQIHESVLDRIFNGSGNSLRHLGLAGGFVYNLDRICRQIGKYNQDIVSIDFYQSRYLSHIGLIALSHCHKLQEVDFGWSIDYMNYDKCLPTAYFREVWDTFFRSNCNLRKIFLAGTPKFDEDIVESMMKHCPSLEQIDLKNIQGFSSDLFPKLRANFTYLQYFSISICDPTLSTPPDNTETPINGHHPQRYNNLPSNYITVARHFKPKTL
ncbi:F-box/LRR-repeat protein 4-like [Lutzomyia longipalpis]|uniref:F-box/LRR-repeat protein 4-like n=1 Tax=Lutzomyia longipalpis TaxID=7200 RepID=UPI0024834195|nr:F-box/LRR-repeat protein 4-like [Lutzomyia longipalpis]